MPWGAVAGAVISGVASYYAAKQQKKGAEEAARLQAEQQQKALEEQKKQYSKVEPYLLEGLQKYETLLTKPESYQKTPGYMFRLQQGLEAAGIPANGRFLSGAQIRAATQYGQNYATAEYQNALNQAAGLGALASGTYQPMAQYAGAVGNIYGNIGTAQAQGVLGASQARAAGILGIGSAASQGIQNYQLARMYNQQPAQSYYGAGQTSGYGSNVSGDAYAPAYGG